MQKVIGIVLLVLSIISYLILYKVPTPETETALSNIMGNVMFASYWAVPTILMILKIKNIRLKINYNIILYFLYATIITSLVIAILNPSSHWSTLAIALSFIVVITKENTTEALFRNLSLVFLLFLIWEAIYITSQYSQVFTTGITNKGIMGFTLLMSFILIGIWFNLSYLHLLKGKWNIQWVKIIPILIASSGLTIYWIANWMPYSWDKNLSTWNVNTPDLGVWIIHKASKVILLSSTLWIRWQES